MSIAGVRLRHAAGACSAGRPGSLRDDLPSARRFRINLSVIFRIDQGE
jgi:hypothetical protein